MMNPTYDVNKYSVLMPNTTEDGDEFKKVGSSDTLPP